MEERLACVDDGGLLEKHCQALQQQVKEMEVYSYTLTSSMTHNHYRSSSVIMAWCGWEAQSTRTTK